MFKEEIITHINIDKLKEHPKNPRHDYGDLSELTESIRKNGIMQNLTVLADDDEMESFTVLIGHRRLKAAKAAGFRRIPCRVIFDMPEADQIALMMEENMQRNDLTVCEQAWGFQMMLDLGETAESIADKTGFNKATVYHRLNLAKLDRNLLKEKQEDESFQMSIHDMYLLEKIPDEKTRNSILKRCMKSSDLKYAIESELKKREIAKNREENIGKIKALGIREASEEENKNKYSKYRQLRYFNIEKKQTFDFGEILEGRDPDECFYSENYGWAYIYAPIGSEAQAETEAEKEKRIRDENRQILKGKLGDLKEKRIKFLKDTIIKGIPDSIDRELTHKLICIFMDRTLEMACDDVTTFLGSDAIKLTDEMKEMKSSELLLAQASRYMSEEYLVDWNGSFRGDEEAIDFYGVLLDDLGFRLTGEEQEMVSGTHELYYSE